MTEAGTGQDDGVNSMPFETKFVTLGTAGGPTPKPHRMPPAHALVHEGGTILVDCGEGAFQQLARAGFDLRKVQELFISHHHFDHIGSLFACLGLNMMMHRDRPMNIYGPPGTAEIVQHLIAACDIPQAVGFGVPGQVLPHPRDFVVCRDLSPGEVVVIDAVRVSCCENTHYRPEAELGQEGPVSLSYRFDTPDRSILFTGDTGPCRGVEHLARGADLLVGEILDIEVVMTSIRQRSLNMPAEGLTKMEHHMTLHHLTPEALGEMATQAGVGEVLAVHIPFYTRSDEDEADCIRRINAKFSGRARLAEDLAAY